jgi:hypothetical protein
MEPLKVIVDEIRTSIKQTFDDKNVSRAQAAFWVIIIGNRLLSQHNAKRDSGQFLNAYIVPVITPKETVLPNIIAGRKYIELPFQIFDYDRDGGVEYMSFYNPEEGCLPHNRIKKVERASVSQLEWLQMDKNTRPSPKNPYFTRLGDIFPIHGIESVPVKEIEIGIYQTISSLDKIDLEAPFMFPAELMPELKRQVTDLARYNFLFPSDKSNDGSDATGNQQQGKQVPKIISVNQQDQQ